MTSASPLNVLKAVYGVGAVITAGTVIFCGAEEAYNARIYREAPIHRRGYAAVCGATGTLPTAAVCGVLWPIAGGAMIKSYMDKKNEEDDKDEKGEKEVDDHWTTKASWA